MRRAVLLLLILTTALAGKPLVINNGAICENKATGFFVIDNVVLSKADSIVYKDYSEDDCLKTCAQNRDQMGRSILCSSFVYHHESFTCTVYKDKKEPEGQAETEVAIGKRYFEKVCLNEEVPIHCADAQFLRVDHFELIGYAVEVAVTKSLDECLAHCASNTTCKSALYFYEESECILNTESALSKPNDFKQAQDDNKVIYFQNACAAPRVQVEPTTPAPKPEGSNEREGSADEASSEKTTPVPATTEEVKESAAVKKPSEDEEDDEEEEEAEIENEEKDEEKEPGSMLEKVEADHEASTTAATDEGDYEDDKSIEEEEEELRKEKENLKKLTQKASYLKFEKHPRNFASRTLKASDDEAEADKEEHNASHQADEQDEVEQLSKEEDDEPSEAETKPLKKKTKSSKKTVKEVSAESLPEEAYVNYFSEWSDWTPCTKSGERQIRRRKCLDLRKCLGALMQVRNCPAIIPTIAPEKPIESIRSLVAVPPIDYDDTDVRDPVPVVRPNPLSPLLPASDVNTPEAIWSPWQGTCQQFASGQPCNDGQMIGFESRECVAKDPSYCEGTFFRYCTLSC